MWLCEGGLTITITMIIVASNGHGCKLLAAQAANRVLYLIDSSSIAALSDSSFASCVALSPGGVVNNSTAMLAKSGNIEGLDERLKNIIAK